MKNKLGIRKHALVRLINDRQLERVVEVGVSGGGLTQKIMTLCPGVQTYYCVDPWKEYTAWFNRKPLAHEYNQGHYDNIYSKFLKVANRFPDKVVTVRKDSTTAAKEFKRDGVKVDVAYIDAIHDKINIINDIYHWLPNIEDDGVISGHDYAKRFADMVEALHVIFGDSLDILPVNDTVPKMSIGNAQGRNWWVILTAKCKKKFIRNIKANYKELLWPKFPQRPPR